MSMSNHKMKGLLKGLRYISEMFENEKEDDFQIGFPTDVKHVAHIGWDGPSVNSPSWMNDFKAAPGGFSQPLAAPGEMKEESEIQWVSEDSRRRNQTAPAKETEVTPKSSRRHGSTGSSSQNPGGEKTEKQHKSRRSSKANKEGSESSTTTKSRKPKEPSSQDGGEPSSKVVPDIPKKSRRKKSKDAGDGGGSSRSSRNRRAQASKSSDLVPEESESISKEVAQAPGFNSSEAVENKGFIEIY